MSTNHAVHQVSESKISCDIIVLLSMPRLVFDNIPGGEGLWLGFWEKWLLDKSIFEFYVFKKESLGMQIPMKINPEVVNSDMPFDGIGFFSVSGLKWFWFFGISD